MISCNELRIGNYVLAGKNLARISMIRNKATSNAAAIEVENGKDGSEKLTLENVGPVPLTNDILAQCNFVYHSYFKFWQLLSTEEKNRSEMDIDRDYNILDFMRKPIVKSVSSLHQLQNLYFMLKGKELTFREPA